MRGSAGFISYITIFLIRIVWLFRIISEILKSMKLKLDSGTTETEKINCWILGVKGQYPGTERVKYCILGLQGLNIVF